MIDPQTQANKFIKLLAKDPKDGPEAGINVMKTSDPTLLRTLEMAIQTGKWVLIENVGESLDPALEPILLQQKIKTGAGWQLRVGEKLISYDDHF